MQRTAGPISEPTQSLRRVGELLALFTPTRVQIGLSDLSRSLGTSKATAHRLAQSLTAIGLLDQDPESREYRLGTRLLELGTLVAGSMDIRTRSLPRLRLLAESLGETTYLMVLQDHQAICIERIEGTHPLRDVITQIGTTLPLYAGAAGVAMLAHLPESVVDAVLEGPREQRTAATVVDPEAITQRLKEVRARGYAMAMNDLVVGTGAIAAPIYTSSGDVVGAVSVGSVTPTLEVREADIAAEVVAASRHISAELGYTGREPAAPEGTATIG